MKTQNKNQEENFLKPLVKKYKKMNNLDKRLLWSFLGIMLISLMFNISIETYRAFNSDVSLSECNALRISDVRYYLSLQEQNPTLAFIYAFEIPIKFIIIAIGIAWIVHGVGFHIIKR
jgi:hypothetical protein